MGLMDIRRKLLAEALQLKSATRSFYTDMSLPLKTCQIPFSLEQEGGTPSPTAAKNITGKSSITVTTTLGKNLYNKDRDLLDHYINSSGDIAFGGNGYWNLSTLIPVTEGQKVTVRGITTVGSAPRWAWYKADETIFQVFVGTVGTVTLTVPTGASYLRLSVYSTNRDTLQVEHGEEATTYEAYHGQNATIALGGTYYGGTVDLPSGTLTITHAYQEYDGDEEGWVRDASTRYRIEIPGVVSVAQRKELICNRGVYAASGGSGTNGSCFYYSGRFYYYQPTSITTLDEFKIWLGTHNLQIVYPLATPVTISITPAIARAILGQNDLNTNGDGISVQYWTH